MTSVGDVIEAFRGGPPGYGEAYPLLFGLAEERPGQLPVLARQVLDDLPAGSELTRAVLPWLDVADLLALADQAAAGMRAGSRARLDLGYCFGCEIPAFYGHDADGRPRRLGQSLNDWQPSPFDAPDVRPAVSVRAMQPLPRWQRQDWSLAHDRENLNRIGGEPTWIQEPEYPACPSCAAAMPFLAQLDWSHLIDGEGITYILWCQPCAVSAILYQST